MLGLPILFVKRSSQFIENKERGAGIIGFINFTGEKDYLLMTLPEGINGIESCSKYLPDNLYKL